MWRLKLSPTVSDDSIRKMMALADPGNRGKLRLPNIIGVGSARCGTSYLWGMLNAHEKFYVSPLKEVNFFGIKQAPFARNGWTLDDYKMCFASQKDQPYIAEVTPVYIANSIALQQIAMHLKPVKIIITLRHPIDRFISQFRYHQEYHHIQSLSEYVSIATGSYIPGFLDMKWMAPEKAIQLSLYSAGVRTIIESIPKRDVLLLCYEDLVADDSSWKVSLSEFFKLDFSAIKVDAALQNRSHNLGEVLSTSEEDRLREIFLPDVLKLSRLTGRNFGSLWGFT
jgi:hypothetical protein